MNSLFIAKVLRRLGVLASLSINFKLVCNGQVFHVPVMAGLNEGMLAQPLSFKTDILRLLKTTGLEISTFVDVGVNYGQTLIEIAAFSPSLRYFGFEPNPLAYSLASRLVTANSLPFTLFPWGCSSQSSPVKLFLCSAVDTGATTCPDIRPDTYLMQKGEWIAAYPLDEIADFMNLEHNFLLKIDVEGGELEVLKGARCTIRALRPIVMCEVLHAHRPSEVAANEAHKRSLEQYFSDVDYALFLIELPRTGKQHLLGLSKIDAFPKATYSESPHTCDYLFIPQELVPLLEKASYHLAVR